MSKKIDGGITQLELLGDELLSDEAIASRNGEFLLDDKVAYEDSGFSLPLITAEWPDGRADREVEVDFGEVTKRSLPFYRGVTDSAEEIEKTMLGDRSIAKFSFGVSSDLSDKFTEEYLGDGVITTKKIAGPEDTNGSTSAITDLETETEFKIESDGVREVPKFELDKDEKKEGAAKSSVVQFPSGRWPKYQGQIKSNLFPKGEDLEGPIVSAPSTRTAKFSPKKFGLSLSVPFVLTLGFYLLGNSDNAINTWLSGIGVRSLPHAAPAGLELQSLTSQVRTLSDGHRILDISGTIQNSTPVLFREISLIARGFDKRNQKISEIVVPAFNGLQNIQLQSSEGLTSMKFEMVSNLQAEQGLKTALKPLESVPIRLAIPVDNVVPSYFDTVVYSVFR